MTGILRINRCGGCHFGKLIPQDITKRMCWGAPPSATQVPAGPNQMRLQMARPIVNVSDEACALYRGRDEAEKFDEQAALKTQSQPVVSGAAQ